MLNHFNVQGERLEDGVGKKLKAPIDVPGCYDIGTCGFWTLAFCIEAAECESFEELQEKCNNNEFLIRIAKRVSAIIDNQDLVNEEDLETYEIPANSVCIPSYLRLNNGPITEYCANIREMLIEVGPEIKRIGTGKSASVMLAEQHQNDNTHILDTTSLFEYSLNQSTIQPKSQSLPSQKSHYWRDKVTKSKSKSTPNLSKSEHSLS